MTTSLGVCALATNVLRRRHVRSTSADARPREVHLPAALAAVLAAATVITATATGQAGASVIRLTVPVSAVHAHATKVAPKGMSPGDGFQESYGQPRPAKSSARMRSPSQPSTGEYSSARSRSSTARSFTPAVRKTKTTPPTRSSAAQAATKTSAGTVTTHTISRTRVQITITTEPQ